MKIINEEPNWDLLKDKNISDQTINLLKKLLSKIPVNRISLNDAQQFIIEHIDKLDWESNFSKTIKLNEEEINCIKLNLEN